MCLKTHVPFEHIGLDALPDKMVLCEFCHEKRPTTVLTAGPLYASGEQAFACNSHAWNKGNWLNQWAVFQAKQRKQIVSDLGRPQSKTSILEIRPLPRLTDLANDVAQHLQTRQSVGKGVIIAERPAVFLSILRRRWMKIIRILQRQRASTLDTSLIKQLQSDIKLMQLLYFVCGLPGRYPDANVYVVTPEQAGEVVAGCRTVYFCISESALCCELSAYLEEGSMVITYKDEPTPESQNL